MDISHFPDTYCRYAIVLARYALVLAKFPLFFLHGQRKYKREIERITLKKFIEKDFPNRDFTKI